MQTLSRVVHLQHRSRAEHRDADTAVLGNRHHRPNGIMSFTFFGENIGHLILRVVEAVQNCEHATLLDSRGRTKLQAFQIFFTSSCTKSVQRALLSVCRFACLFSTSRRHPVRNTHAVQTTQAALYFSLGTGSINYK